jgi:uncharacterized zinc-type alcohol dehydrogenase-like protein
MTVHRRDVGPHDVRIAILFCGICHSDLHTARNEWASVMPTVYPCVPGHEIVGRVMQVGSAVTGHKPGDIVGVGCLVDSDDSCPNCREHLEQFCPNATYTYNSPDRHGTAPVTYGGYSESITVRDRFVLRIPANLDPAAVAPLLCAGITTYSPLKRYGVRAGMKVGIIGLGGLGHMGVKFSRAFGAHTVVLTTSPSKSADALRLGAHEVVVSRDPEAMARHVGSFDFLLDTVAGDHDLNMYLSLLKREGTMSLVGAPERPMPLSSFSLIFGRRNLTGSLIGGIAETQEMLDFCGERSIVSDVEVIAPSMINHAYERMLKGDVKYRFSIDMSRAEA